ncbi:MAG: BadF/BadG/BcrA/BcrD ATPase family protein [Calditrichia bacterium]
MIIFLVLEYSCLERVIRKLRKGPGNISVLGRRLLSILIGELTDELLRGRKTDEIAGATFAFAGAGRVPEKRMAGEVIQEAGIKNFTIMTDAEILHYSIFGEQAGILISAGTGSVCLVKRKDLGYLQLGGWGYLLGDEGSGFHIGNLAIRRVLHNAQKGNVNTGFTQKILSFYNIDHPRNIISAIYSSSNPSNLVASCARLVCELAEAGDAEADSIIMSAAEVLVDLAQQAILYYDLNESEKYRISLAGSILADVSAVNRKFREIALKRNLKLEYIAQEMEPSAAAVLHAMKMADAEIPGSLTGKLKSLRFNN